MNTTTTTTKLSKIGVVDAGNLYAKVGTQVIVDQVSREACAVDLYRKMLKHGLDALWITPGASWPMTNFFQVPEGSGWHFKRYPLDAEQDISSVSGYCTNASPEARNLRMLVWPEHTGWDWDESNPLALLDAINLLQRGLGVNLSSSPGVTGRSFILRELAKVNKHHYLSSVEMDLHDLPFKSGAKSLAWKQATICTGERCYLHHIDKNSMFLSAAGGLDIGIGDPVRCNTEDIVTIYQAKAAKPGLYRISLGGQETTPDKTWRFNFDGISGPDPLYGTLEDDNRQEWVTAPLLKLLYDFGFQVAIHDGWHWKTSKRFLEQPAPKLWDLRVQFQGLAMRANMEGHDAPGAYLAADSMKTIITNLFGILGSDLVKDPRYYRPDIWAGVIELAKARMIYNIDKLASQRGVWPVAVLTDGLWYISPEKDVWKALAPLMDMEKAGGLGNFKHEYTVEIDEQVRQALQAEDVGTMHQELNALIEGGKVAVIR